MRKIAYGTWILWTICWGCGASTGLSEGFSDNSLGSASSNSTGGVGAFGGYTAAPGGTYGVGGASYYVSSAGYGAMMATGGSSYYYAGGSKATGGTTYYQTGGKAYTGGSKATGGGTYYNVGGKAYTGGSKATGGSNYNNTGGKAYTGGSKATGGSTYGGKASGGYTGTGGGSITGRMKIATDGYVSMYADLYSLHGYVNSFAGGSNTLIQVSYTSSEICATGIVAANPSYISYAGIGVNVNQSNVSSAGSSTSTLSIDAKYITIWFSNDYGSQLRVQLNDVAGTGWCYDITGASSPVTVPLYSFNTSCWDNTGDPFKPGTAITTLSMVVPGDSVSERKYSFCLYGVSFQ